MKDQRLPHCVDVYTLSWEAFGVARALGMTSQAPDPLSVAVRCSGVGRTVHWLRFRAAQWQQGPRHCQNIALPCLLRMHWRS